MSTRARIFRGDVFVVQESLENTRTIVRDRRGRDALSGIAFFSSAINARDNSPQPGLGRRTPHSSGYLLYCLHSDGSSSAAQAASCLSRRG